MAVIVGDDERTIPKPPGMFDDLPSPVHYSEQVRPPRKRYVRLFLSSIGQHKVILLAVLATGLFVAAAVLVGYGVYSNRDQLQRGLAESVLPSKAVPQDVLVDHQEMTRTLSKLLGSIHSLADRNRAIVNLRPYVRGYQDLSARAISMGPLSESEFNSLAEVFETVLPERSEQVNDSCNKMLRDRSLAGSAFQEMLAQIITADKNFAPTLQAAWEPIPPAESDIEETSRQIKSARRRVWAAVMSVKNEKDFQRLSEVFEEVAAELESILVKRMAGGDSGVSFAEAAAQLKYDDDFLVQAQTKFERLTSTYPNAANEVSSQRYTDAVKALENFYRRIE